MDGGLDAMRHWIGRHDWSGLEAEFDRRCRELDARSASRIADIDLRDYEGELADGLRKAADSIGGSTKAVYWEFDPDNDWSSAFFLCRSYQPEAEGDDGWAADFDEQAIVRGPSASALARQFASGWDKAPSATEKNLDLIARTIAAFGRACGSWASTVPLCAGFHDQDLVFRIREGRSAT